MSRLNDKSKLLQILAETPIVSFACKKVGIDRRTYYRWYKDDINFREKVDRDLSIGRMNGCDLSKTTILKAIKGGNLKAAIFWLQHNDPIYRPVRTTYVDPENHEHELKPGEVCKSCGFMEPPIEEYKTNKGKVMTDEELARELYKRLRVRDRGKFRTEEEIRKIINDFITKNNVKNEIIFTDFSKTDDKEDSEKKDS